MLWEKPCSIDLGASLPRLDMTTKVGHDYVPCTHGQLCYMCRSWSIIYHQSSSIIINQAFWIIMNHELLKSEFSLTKRGQAVLWVVPFFLRRFGTQHPNIMGGGGLEEWNNMRLREIKYLGASQGAPTLVSQYIDMTWGKNIRRDLLHMYTDIYIYVPGSKLPLFPYNRGWSSTQ